jgi:large subunit ribosomal protein L25
MKTYKLKANKRKVTGRKVKALRKKGLVPANVFGKGVKSLAIEIENAEFEKLFKEAGETSIIDLLVGKQKKPVLVHEMQTDPVTDDLLHVDFHQVNLKEKVSAAVPIELINEAPAEKQGLGTTVQYLDEIEVEALPTELPDKFEVDLSTLTEVNSSILVKDLNFDKSKISLAIDEDEMVVKVEPLRKEEEEPAPVETEGEEGEEEVTEEGTEGEEKVDEKEEDKEEEKPEEKKE